MVGDGDAGHDGARPVVRVPWSTMPTRSKATSVIPVTNNDEANDFLVESPLALLIGMLLDHKVR